MAVNLPSTIEEAISILRPSVIELESLCEELEFEYGANPSEELKLYFWRIKAAECLPLEQRFVVPVPEVIASKIQELSSLKNELKMKMSEEDYNSLSWELLYFSLQEQLDLLKSLQFKLDSSSV